MEDKLSNFLSFFEANGRDETVQRCVYIYGAAGCGKTTFASMVLKKNNYDFISYTASDMRNKNIIESLTVYNISCSDIMSSFLNGGVKRKLAVLMDEIECMNTGDKSGLNALIKMVRPKRTKKQKLEESTHIPIVCIGNTSVDKKITELMKCSLVLEMPTPSADFIRSILGKRLPDNKTVHAAVIEYANGDLNKLDNICGIILDFGEDVVRQFEKKKTVLDPKQIVHALLRDPPCMNEHSELSEPDRTIVSMLWHENVGDLISMPQDNSLYESMLENLCFADFIDRATFQKQIWQFNEMSSLIKTFYVNTKLRRTKRAHGTIRFTKILTKYSTEYNNVIFLQRLCQCTGYDKNDLLLTVYSWRQSMTAEQITARFNVDTITLVDVNRLLRYLDKLYLTVIDE